jgi:hypothetical protein
MEFDQEKLVQAIIVLVRVFIVAGLTGVLASLTILTTVISDPWLASFVIATITSLVSGALKWLGGPTTPANAFRDKRPSKLAL